MFYVCVGGELGKPAAVQEWESFTRLSPTFSLTGLSSLKKQKSSWKIVGSKSAVRERSCSGTLLTAGHMLIRLYSSFWGFITTKNDWMCSSFSTTSKCIFLAYCYLKWESPVKNEFGCFDLPGLRLPHSHVEHRGVRRLDSGLFCLTCFGSLTLLELKHWFPCVFMSKSCLIILQTDASLPACLRSHFW